MFACIYFTIKVGLLLSNDEISHVSTQLSNEPTSTLDTHWEDTYDYGTYVANTNMVDIHKTQSTEFDMLLLYCVNRCYLRLKTYNKVQRIVTKLVKYRLEDYI